MQRNTYRFDWLKQQIFLGFYELQKTKTKTKFKNSMAGTKYLRDMSITTENARLIKIRERERERERVALTIRIRLRR
jgi:hypothetical protein